MDICQNVPILNLSQIMLSLITKQIWVIFAFQLTDLEVDRPQPVSVSPLCSSLHVRSALVLY